MEQLTLPDEVKEATGTSPKDLVILSIPKMGKSVILGEFTKSHNALVLDLEKGGYEYISARKISTYKKDEDGIWESFQNYIKYRELLLNNKGKYDYLLIDGLSDLDALSEIGGTLTYMDSVIGKRFNREGGDMKGKQFFPDHPEYKSVLTLPDGAGYNYTRRWFLQQIDMFKQIAPYRIYAAHIVDKYIKDNGKEEVIGGELSLTGKLKTIFASRVTSMAKLVAEEDERYLNFNVLNDSIVAGSRAPHLTGKILISREEENKKIKTFWENIYGN